MSLTKRLLILAFAGSSLMMCSGSDADASLDALPIDVPLTEQELIERELNEQEMKKKGWYRAESSAPAVYNFV